MSTSARRTRWEGIAVALLCAIAGVRVFVFAAGFPFFNNMDEQAHLDLVLKFARGYWPNRPVESFDRDAAELFTRYGTLEFLNPPTRFPGGTFPLPYWRRPGDLTEALDVRVPYWMAKTNHEAHSPPLYYVVASLWHRLGIALGFTGGTALYWVRFLNVGLAPLLIWFTYRFCRVGWPDRPELRLGVAMLAAFMPFDAWYAVNSDALGPLLGVASLLATLHWYRRTDPTPLHTIAVAGLASASVLLKYSHVAIVGVFVAMAAWRARQTARTGHIRLAWSIAAGVLVAMAPIAALLVRNYLLFGDLTATSGKVEHLGWRRHSLAELVAHPVFTPAGFWAFWSRLAQTLWRGEMRWYLEPIADPTADTFYAVGTSITLAVAALAWLKSRREPGTSAAREVTTAARAMVLTVPVTSVMVLAVLSASFDYGRCFYPSREFPYLASARLVASMMIPVLVLYVEGIAVLCAPLRRLHPDAAATATLTLVGAVCAYVTSVELALSSLPFASLYNWFHLP